MTNLAAQMRSTTQVLLSFTNLSSGMTGYTVQYATNAGGTNWAAIPGTITQAWSATTPAAGAAVTLTLTWPGAGVPNNSMLRFRVAPTYTDVPAATPPVVTGPWSNVPAMIDLGTPPAAPTGLGTVLGAAGSRQITLNWTDVANSNASYQLQWRSATTAAAVAGAAWGNANPAVVPAIAGNAVSYLFTGINGVPVTTGRFYQFRIRGVNVNGNSAWVLTPAGTGSVLAP